MFFLAFFDTLWSSRSRPPRARWRPATASLARLWAMMLCGEKAKPPPPRTNTVRTRGGAVAAAAQIHKWATMNDKGGLTLKPSNSLYTVCHPLSCYVLFLMGSSCHLWCRSISPSAGKPCQKCITKSTDWVDDTHCTSSITTWLFFSNLHFLELYFAFKVPPFHHCFIIAHFINSWLTQLRSGFLSPPSAHACCKYQLGPTTPTTIPLTRVDQEREEEEEGRQESGPREDNEGERRQRRIGGESTFVILESFAKILLPDRSQCNNHNPCDIGKLRQVARIRTYFK